MDFGTGIFEEKNMVDDLKEAIKEIKKLGKEFRKQNGDSPLPANKDFNLWIVSQLLTLRDQVASNRAKIKMLMWALALGVPCLIFTLKIILR